MAENRRQLSPGITDFCVTANEREVQRMERTRPSVLFLNRIGTGDTEQIVPPA